MSSSGTIIAADMAKNTHLARASCAVLAPDQRRLGEHLVACWRSFLPDAADDQVGGQVDHEGDA